MQVFSRPPLPAEDIPSALLSDPGRQAEPLLVEDEEFPLELPSHYEWMLQPGSQSHSNGFKHLILVLLTILLIGVSVFVVHKISNPSRSVLASPASRPR